jgi:hypothetical protein
MLKLKLSNLANAKTLNQLPMESIGEPKASLPTLRTKLHVEVATLSQHLKPYKVIIT